MDWFTEVEFPDFEDLLADVPHGNAVAIMKAFKGEMNDWFEAMKKDGRWSYTTAAYRSGETLTCWEPVTPDTWFGYAGFPVDIEFKPADLAESFQDEVKRQSWKDGMLDPATRTALADSLDKWRRAIEAAAQTLNAAPVRRDA